MCALVCYSGGSRPWSSCSSPVWRGAWIRVAILRPVSRCRSHISCAPKDISRLHGSILLVCSSVYSSRRRHQIIAIHCLAIASLGIGSVLFIIPVAGLMPCVFVSRPSSPQSAGRAHPSSCFIRQGGRVPTAMHFFGVSCFSRVASSRG